MTSATGTRPTTATKTETKAVTNTVTKTARTLFDNVLPFFQEFGQQLSDGVRDGFRESFHHGILAMFSFVLFVTGSVLYRRTFQPRVPGVDDVVCPGALRMIQMSLVLARTRKIHSNLLFKA